MLSDYTYAMPYGTLILLQQQEVSISHFLCKSSEYLAFHGLKPIKRGDMVDLGGGRKLFRVYICC